MEAVMQLRIGKLEFRHNESSNPEIVEWSSTTSYDSNNYKQLVSWDKGNSGYSINMLDNRAFDVDNKDVLWAMMQYGTKVLDALDELNKEVSNG